MNTVVLVSGGFDPIHSGHINLLKEAANLGDWLVVALNSDNWLTRKKSAPFMSFEERKIILENLQMVDKVIAFNDIDNTAIDAIYTVLDLYPISDIIFANGGDRTEGNVPEEQVVDKRLYFEYNVGGSNKANSSSWLLQEWKAPKTERSWGYYRVLHQDSNTTKIKELTVDPGQSLSLQRHKNRSEHWHVAEGIAYVYYGNDVNSLACKRLNKLDSITIPANTWHQLVNDTTEPLRIVEIQYGEKCIEEDIERY